MERHEWVALARTEIVKLLEKQHAVTIREMEARLAEPDDPTLLHDAKAARGIDPYHLSTARQQLLEAGTITSAAHTTRGSGAPINLIHLTSTKGRATKINKAKARKALLTRRHHRYSASTKRYPNGLVGPAAETALHTALDSTNSYVVQQLEPGDMRYVLGVDLQSHGGPIDNAATLVTYDNTGGESIFTCLFEVKNQREWFTPEDQQVHRFLHKASEVQAANPGSRVVPVLVTRRRQIRLLKMGRDLGFFSIQFKLQHVRPVSEVDSDHLQEVRSELGYTDLVDTDRPGRPMIAAVERSLPNYAQEIAATWETTGQHFGELYADLRDTAERKGRSALIAQLKEELSEDFDQPAQGW